MIVVGLLLFTAALTIAQSIQTIGYSEANVTNGGLDPSPYVLAGNVFLLPDAVLLPGILFAFSVYFRSPDSVTLQIYRPIDPAVKSYRLIAQFIVLPSVMRGREDMYIESLLNRRCIAALPGDRLGVYVATDPPSLQLKFNANNKAGLYKVTGSPLIGQSISDPTEYPLSFQAKAFVVTNDSSIASSLNSSSSVDADCIFGLIIPGAFDGASLSTTIVPITGAVGATGATGPMGFTGNTGERGVPGANGTDGPMGSTGDPGPVGLNGPMGATGFAGAKGPQGGRGATGTTGGSEPGDRGISGPKGPLGEVGLNRTIFLNRQLPPNQGQLDKFLPDGSDAFWSSPKAIWATYIWLAIVSLLLLTVIIIIIVIMAFHASINRSNRSASKSVHSRSNILEETPSTYSDIALQ